MQRLLVVGLVAALCGGAWAQSAPSISNSGGMTLDQVRQSEKMVTIVLKDSGAEDRNLRVVDIGPDYLSALSQAGDRVTYLFSSVQEIRLQEGVLQNAGFTAEQYASLRAEEQKVVDRAFVRAKEIYDNAQAQQADKMRAAMLIACNGDSEAEEYLKRLAASNDLETELDAATYLYLLGNSEVNPKIIEQGLEGGNRRIKAKAALLAGVTKAQAAIPVLEAMLADRDADIAVPAAHALARMEHRGAVPLLLTMLQKRDNQSGNAAVFALSRLGGQDVIDALKAMFKDASEITKHRIGLILYGIGDPEGEKMLKEEITETPTLARGAAIALAKNGIWDGKYFLIKRMERPYDETPEKMIDRAEMCVALIKGGDPTVVSALQSLLSSNDESVRRAICFLLVDLGRRRLIPIVQSSMENSSTPLALDACMSAVAMAKPELRERLVEAREYPW